MNDKEIYEGIRSNNPEILHYIYEVMYPRISSFVMKNSGTGGDAYDLFQDGMIIFFGIAKKGGYYEKTWEGFFYGICKRLWLTKLKKRKTVGHQRIDIERLSINDEEEPWELFSVPSVSMILKEKLQEIKPECNTLLTLQFFEGRKQAEIAEILGYTLKFIRIKAMRCKEELKKKLLADSRFQYHLS